MFKFLPSDDDIETGSCSPQTKNDDKSSPPLRPFTEVTIRPEHHELASQIPVTVSATSPNIKYLKVSDLLNSPQVGQDPKVKAILGSSSDLISGEYEGGFKLWESTFDLLSYMEAEANPEIFGIGPDTKVLDLGCGSGLLGLYALEKGAGTVVFQDYNVEVLDFLTIPNCITNFDGGLLSRRARFFGGSWSSMSESWKVDEGQKEGSTIGVKFDVILSSETIYNLEYLEDFVKLVDNCLSPRGSLFLAAKTCYFGVGGGTTAFISLMKSKPNFAVDIVKVVKQGVQREVLKVYRKSAVL